MPFIIIYNLLFVYLYIKVVRSQHAQTPRQDSYRLQQGIREAKWDNYLHRGPRGHVKYHHAFEHCI